MTTTKKRLNISLSPRLESAVKKLAKRDKMPQAGKVTQLLETALEIEEDRVWDKLAQKRDNRRVKLVSHKKAWE